MTAPAGVRTGTQSGGGQREVPLRRDSAMVIMDEPSSGLDAEAEHELHERLRELRSGRTSLLISHRLNTIRDADTIIVLAGGTVVESGSHADLMALGSRYATLFRLQASGYVDE